MPKDRLERAGVGSLQAGRSDVYRFPVVPEVRRAGRISSGSPEFFVQNAFRTFADFARSANALLGPTPTGFALKCKCPIRTHPDIICGKCRNLTETMQMPYSDPPRQDLGVGGVTILRAVQMPYPDPPRQDLRSSANALLGPTPTEIAGNVGNTTGPVQMPYSDPPRQDLRGGGN